MEDVDRFYLTAVSAYSELRKAGVESGAVTAYVSQAFLDRIAPDLPKHPAAGFTRPDASVTVPDKISGLRIYVIEGQAEEFIVRA